MKNVLTAINAVMQEVGYVKKQKSAGLNYSYAGEAALIANLRPAMVEQGLVMYVAKVYDVESREYASKSGAAMVNVTLTCDFVFCHAASGESLTVSARGEGSDSGDKANNKAMTCAYKYALRETFMIETGDDPDGKLAPRVQPTSAISPASMTLDEAKQVKGSDGIRYGERTTKHLSAIAKNVQVPTEKRYAAQMIIDSRTAAAAE